jgi:hypothetical protein
MMSHGKDKTNQIDDLQLDLLVDDELPEAQRAPVLRALDATPGRWRELAIRFMQRQVERKAIRQMIEQRGAGERKPARSLPFPREPIHHWRVAAAFIITAGLAASAAFYYSRNTVPSSESQVSSLMVTVPSGPLTGSLGSTPADSHMNLPVAVTPTDVPDIGRMLREARQRGEESHLIVTPNGQNGAVVFPVTTVKDEKVY